LSLGHDRGTPAFKFPAAGGGSRSRDYRGYGWEATHGLYFRPGCVPFSMLLASAPLFSAWKVGLWARGISFDAFPEILYSDTR
jgi:hypothetical protein